MTNYHPDPQRAYESHCADGYVVPDDETGPQEPTSGPVRDFPSCEAPRGAAPRFEPGESDPAWRQWARDEIQRLRAQIAVQRLRGEAGRLDLEVTRHERDEARDLAARLEADNAALAEVLREVRGILPDQPCEEGNCGAAVCGMAKRVDRALSDTTGEATRCSTCGQPMDSPGCAKSLLGISGHPGNGGCEATR